MRTKLIVILSATAAAAIGAAAGIAQSGAISTHAPASAAASPRVVVVRGPRGYRGRRGAQGPRGPQGPAGAQGPAGSPGTDFAANLNINWHDAGTASGHDTASVDIPGIGTLSAVCNTSQQTLQLTPADPSVRTVANISDFEGSTSSNSQPYSAPDNGNPPIIIASPTQPNHALPPNGMMMITFSVQPVNGNGGAGPAPATLTLSSEYVVNDPNRANDYCYLAGQVVKGG